MPSDSAPKSAYELAMERLRKKDEDTGVVERPITDAQRDAIAEARRIADAKIAELQIMHRSKALGLVDPAEREAAEAALRRDIQRVGEERDRRIERIRSGQ
jgi:hypothetical protein